MHPQILRHAFSELTIFVAMLSAVLPNVFAQPGNPQSIKDSRFKGIDIPYYTKQIADYTDEIKKHPNDAELHYGRGATYAYINKLDEAMADLDKAIELNKNYDKSYLWRGYVYRARKQYDDAIKDFSKAIELNPANDEAREQREICLSELNKAGAFIQKIDGQLKLTPLDPELYSLRAETYAKIGKKKEAEADLEKFQELNAILKKDVLGECISTDYDCQIDIYTEKIKITRDTRSLRNLSSLYSSRGIAYYKKGDLDNALSDFNNGSSDVSVYKGNIYLQKGKYDEVLSLFKCERKTGSAEASLLCGEVLLHKTNYDKAFDFFEEAIRLNSRTAKAYFGRGVIYLERGRNYSEYENDAAKSAEAYKNAVKDFDTVIEIDLNNANPEVYFKRAKAYEKLGKPEKAVADRKKFEELTQKP